MRVVRGRLPGDGTLLATHLTAGEAEGTLLSPEPTPSATPEPAETEDSEDDPDEMTPEPSETEELDDAQRVAEGLVLEPRALAELRDVRPDASLAGFVDEEREHRDHRDGAVRSVEDLPPRAQ